MIKRVDLDYPNEKILSFSHKSGKIIPRPCGKAGKVISVGGEVTLLDF